MPKWYNINWDKVETLEDLKLIIKAVSIKIADDHKDIANLARFLGDEDLTMQPDFSQITPVTIEGEIEGPKDLIS